LKKVNVGIVGYGTVGNGVAKILEEDKELISKKAGFELHLKKVYTRNWDKTFAYPLPDEKKAYSLEEIISRYGE